jgi:hypothetical protein
MRRRVAALAVAAISTAACSGGNPRGSGDASTAANQNGPIVTAPLVAPSPREDTTSALGRPDDPRLPKPLIDLDELISGGPPPDGIPSIDAPKFHRTGDVGFLMDNEPVLAVEIQGDARAYPVQVLIWHEIVNDTVGGVPVAVTYCPLCNSAIAFDRRSGNRVLEFGTSGLLYRSALVMYDRQTRSLWSHFTGEAVAGVLTGTRLDNYPVSTVSWVDWRTAHPDGLVLSRETGFDRSYGRNPYPGYDDVNSSPFLFLGKTDDRLAAKARVVGIQNERDPVAVRLDRLADRGVIELTIEGRHVVVWHRPGTASALDKSRIDAGADIGATGVFAADIDGRALSFERRDDAFVDKQTGSRWDILGRGIAGPLADRQLEPIPHVDTFWFAWAAFRPQTRVVP